MNKQFFYTHQLATKKNTLVSSLNFFFKNLAQNNSALFSLISFIKEDEEDDEDEDEDGEEKRRRRRRRRKRRKSRRDDDAYRVSSPRAL